MQEQNMKLARYSTGAFLQGAKKQREAMQAMLEGPFRVYTGLLYAPISSRETLHATDPARKTGTCR